MKMNRWGRRLSKPVEVWTDLTLSDSEGLPATNKLLASSKTIAIADSGDEAEQDDWHAPLNSTPCETLVAAHASRDRRFIPIYPRVSMAFQRGVRAGVKPFVDVLCTPSPSTAGSLAHLQARPATTSTGNGRNGTIRSAGATLVWLRPFDLRLHDHPAFSYAAQRRLPVHVVFVWSDAEDAAEGEWQLAGTAAAVWLHQAIASLDASLKQKYSQKVVVRTGKSIASAVLAAAQEGCVDEVVTSCACEPSGPSGRTTDAVVKMALEAAGIKLRSFNSFLLQDINEVRVDLSTYRGHFGTLQPFHQACMLRPAPPRPKPEPPALERPSQELSCDGLAALGFARMPKRCDGSVVDWAAPMLEAWDVSEEAALATLRQFLSPGGGISRYEKGRQLADASAVTRISPYLRFGMLSSRLMFYEMKDAGAKNQSIVYWRRLVWRDLAYWQLFLFPRMRNDPIRAHYAGQVWNQNPHALERWQQGKTGYPIVDAGMRELWTTGWMAQNVRMVAAILLCEYLNIHWVEGERWFHHTLVDADPAINPMMWQNAGKSGLDQWNFTMNPATAGKTQDPKGEYIRRWCPELAKLATSFVHCPWDAPAHVLKKAGVSIGPKGNYPERIVVDLPAAARKSGDAIRENKKRARDWSNEHGYDLIVLPRGSTVSHDGQKYRVFTKPEFRRANSDSIHQQRSWHEEQPKGKGKGKGRGTNATAARWTNGGSKSHSSSYSNTSGQHVLDEYMKASGA
eukprot:TRINITY_DN7398_c1_g1_i1.p1 TRINITY_DN7398_c1_g1~~TRINITY_DN7398_c1_g1_i1.p1  ORF type:complete len:738 (+),score=145.53 TRINITY_DN7398_c1_g1_i1:114-2327(+)